MLLGHFDADYVVEGSATYKASELDGYDLAFFIGFTPHCDPPERLMKDIFKDEKPFIWMNTGFDMFCSRFDISGKYGFSFVTFDTSSHFDAVKSAGKTYTKGEPNMNIVALAKHSSAEVVATATSSSKRREYPYIVRSGNLLYFADSPFASANETDRYLLFCDMLHDILGQPHEENHRALIRIEDVDVFENPAKLRAIADAFAERNLPFLVGIIPIFVDPGNEMRVTLSDKPDFVDAIHYMVSRGATIVMHGITHQYQGVTATDYEFWDANTDRPIRNDTKDYVERKMRLGLEECWKNGIYPLLWETPHYTASQSDYQVFSEFFNTAMEQRLAIDNSDYSQYFPYIIEKDLHGQRIIPEDLGYIPQSPDDAFEEAAVQNLLRGAKAELNVRDGFASAFIHPFIELKYITEYVDAIRDMGYTFMDVKTEPLVVQFHDSQLHDKIIATGAASYHLDIDDQYLHETWLRDGSIDHQTITPTRINGSFDRRVDVGPGLVYLAEPSEFREIKVSFIDNITIRAKRIWDDFTSSDEDFAEARVALKWDPKASGGGLNDQTSFASALKSINIEIDTLSGDTIGSLDNYNLLIVPYNTVEHLANRDYDRITDFIERGGNIITDGKTDLAKELGITFAVSSIPVQRLRDQLYPEDPLVLKVPETMFRYDVNQDDEIFCSDERTEVPVVIGRHRVRGKFLYFGMRFDPVSNEGFSRFPYLAEYIEKYFHLRPIVRREQVEMYFDPGLRRNMSVEDLVKRWTADGVRVIHVAGWHEYPTWTYDYARLIKLCHANGILVYAWLEPPMVSQKFWHEHPEWREVNAKGDSIPPMWRYVVALTDPECLRTVKGIYRDFLTGYDWDGVNMAELYFESGGPQTPKLLNPMHHSARTEFKRKHGFDPALLIDSTSEYFWKSNPPAWKLYEDYRVETIARLHEEFLTLIDSVKQSRPYLDVVVTVLDNINNPVLRTDLGVDIKRVIGLMKKHDFVLQVEDPESEWSKDPRRYEKLGRQYIDLIGDSTRVMLDLNILPFRQDKVPTQFPTLFQTGVESYQLVRSAAFGTHRSTIYSEATVRPQDLRRFPYAASARATIDWDNEHGWNIATPFPVVLQLPKNVSTLLLSPGGTIFSDNGEFLLPAGAYKAEPKVQSPTEIGDMPVGGVLLSLTGDLMSVSTSTTNVTFAYKSRRRCIASFNHPPYSIIIDGRETSIQAVEGFRRFSVMLPQGDHHVTAILETKVSYGVDLTSFWSSWVIVIFGVLAGAALLTFYLLVRFSRPADTSGLA
jgi:uncharacterized protein YdaL